MCRFLFVFCFLGVFGNFWYLILLFRLFCTQLKFIRRMLLIRLYILSFLLWTIYFFLLYLILLLWWFINYFIDLMKLIFLSDMILNFLLLLISKQININFHIFSININLQSKWITIHKLNLIIMFILITNRLLVKV